jgi:hypothetical protein
VNQRVRPKILTEWDESPCLTEMCSTIRDCWDQDAEARLSASNVQERIKAMRETHQGQIIDNLLIDTICLSSHAYIIFLQM